LRTYLNFGWKALKILLSLIILIGIIGAIIWAITSGYDYFFVSKANAFNVNLSKFDLIQAESEDPCNIPTDNSDIFSILKPAYRNIFRPASEVATRFIYFDTFDREQFPSLEFPPSSIDYLIVFPQNILSLSANVFLSNGLQKHINNVDTKTFTGNARNLEIQYRQIDNFTMYQYFCAQKFWIYGSNIQMYNKSPEGKQYAGFHQFFNDGDNVTLTINYPKNFMGFSPDEVVRVDFFLSSKKTPNYFTLELSEYDPFVVFAQSREVYVNFPIPQGDLGNGEGNELYPTGVEIRRPVGALKIGNKELVPIQGISSFYLDEKLLIPKSPYTKTDFTIIESPYAIKQFPDGHYEISGVANSITLNGDELNKAPWYNLPDYIQAGLFGFLLSVIGGIWATNAQIYTGIISFLGINKNSPEYGDLICVMNSGIIIAGQVILECQKDTSHIVLRNAKQKMNLSSGWEKETIDEITVRIDTIEQSYFFITRA
jgi:hypothetical protein